MKKFTGVDLLDKTEGEITLYFSKEGAKAFREWWEEVGSKHFAFWLIREENSQHSSLLKYVE